MTLSNAAIGSHNQAGIHPSKHIYTHIYIYIYILAFCVNPCSSTLLPIVSHLSALAPLRRKETVTINEAVNEAITVGGG